MSAFRVLDIAETGANVSNTWLEAIAHNLANVNTIYPADQEPFRALLVHAQEIKGPTDTGDGAEVVEILEWDADPMLAWDPDHPLASEEGYVVRPVLDVAHQMADLIAAQRSYQLNLQVIKTGEESYQAALQIGRV